MKLGIWISAIAIAILQVEGECRAKPKPVDKLLGNYPDKVCYRGGVDAWVAYDNFPPCWIYNTNRKRYECYNYETNNKCPNWPGIKDLGPSHKR